MSLAGPPPAWPPPRRGVPGAGAVVAAALLGVLGLVAVAVVAMSVGPTAVPLAALLALVPLAVVLATIAWVDRWEPEPLSALAVAFGWGASVSVLVALVVNTGTVEVLVALGTGVGEASALGATVVAPVIEEVVKALGVLLVLLAWRRSFDGPVDGLVYAATIAAGFAFVENILYFGAAIAGSTGLEDSGAAVATVFVLRAVASPFAHVMFTACVGLALGLAARAPSPAAWLVALPAGLVAAIGLHALWNTTAVRSSAGGFVAAYVTVQVPVFLALVGLVVWLRSREGRVVREQLTAYVHRGVLGPAEVVHLSSLGDRRRAQAWARANGGASAARAMREYQHAATVLAFQAHRVRRQHDLDALRDEPALLAALEHARARLRAALTV